MLDGTGSSDPNPTDSIALFEWDLDNDGQLDDATGATPTFDLVGQDGVFTIGLRVTDEAGATGTDTTTVTVANVAPSLIGVAEDGPKDEDTAVTISGKASDPGWLEPDLDVTIDWGDGSPLDVVNGHPDGVLDTSFAEVIAAVEGVRLDPASTGAELLEQRDVLRDVNAG